MFSLLTAFFIESRKEYFSHDEFFTAVLAGHPSMPAMIETIGRGGEANPPLFFVLEWLMARGFGTGETAMRALSALSTTLAAVLTFFTLRRAAGPWHAALAVALVFGLSRGVFGFMLLARYYGVFVLLAAWQACLFLRVAAAETPRLRDWLGVFVAHTAMVYLHLYGLLFSGMFLVAAAALDWLRGRWRRQLWASVIGAWMTFLVWTPALLRQLKVTSVGSWTPRMPLGLFVDEPGMQTPLATIFLLLAVLALATALSPPATEAPPAPGPHLVTLLTLALAWMLVPVFTWGISQIRQPVYMQRYVAPCVVALALILAVCLWALQHLPAADFVRPGRVPSWLPNCARAAILGFCLLYQPLRAMHNPPRLPAAFTLEDFGHPGVPVVFEDTMDFLRPAFYGRDRDYVMLVDHDAAEASTGYFTKQMDRLLSPYRQHYPGLKVRHADELPTGPEGFLMVKSPLASTFDWILAHRPDFRAEKVGVWTGSESKEEKEVYWARRMEP